MKFAYPEFLYALFAIAIPIIIHLFNFRKYKKLYFSNVEFLKEVQQETQSKSKLKHLLILLSRILAITFLVLAFAQPFVPSSDNNVANQNNAVALYIDNSFSMESVGENGTLLNDAKTKAIEIVKAYRNTDKFILTTNEFNAGDQRLMSNEEVIDKIETIQISSTTRNISTLYSRNKEGLLSSETKNKSFYILSDFQKSTADFEKLKKDTLIDTYLIPVNSTETNNLYIDTCWFSSPTHMFNQNEELTVRIKNNASTDLENIPLKLYINEQMVSPASFSIKANGQTELVLKYRNKSNGIQQGKIELRDSPVIMDDVFYFSYHISNNINILNINNDETTKQLSSIYSTDSIFSHQSFNVNQLDYSLIKKSDLVIINNLSNINSGLANNTKKFVDNGGSVLIFPSNEIDYESYREFLSLLMVNYYTNIDTNKTAVRSLNLEHPIFQNVFESKPEGNLNLPLVSKHYQLSTSTTSFKNNILTLKNGHPFLTEYKVGKGTVYLATSPLNKESSSFSSHALFVPTLYNIALLSLKQHPLFHVIGSNSSIELNRIENESVYHIKNKQIDLIPQLRNNANYTTIFVNSNIKDAGNYLLENNQTKLGLAYNYNRSESELNYFTTQELDEISKKNELNFKILNTNNSSVKSALSEANLGKKYWKYCIILALLFLAAEIALIKLFK